MNNMKSSHSNPSIGFNLKLRLSACARRAGKTALLIAALACLAGSAFAQSATMADAGATAPTLTTYDIGQTTGIGHDNGGNYYVNHNPYCGQSFTTLSTRSTYPLTSLYVKDLSGNNPGSQTYTLYVYSMTNISAGTATLLTTYSIPAYSIVLGDWIKISGLTNILNASSIYAFSLKIGGSYWELDNSSSDVYAGGVALLLPPNTGTIGTTYPSSDAAFDAYLSMSVAPTAFSPISPVWTNAPVTLSAPVTGGAGPFTYDWQVSTDQGVTYSDLGAGNGSPTYSLNPANLGGTTNYYRLIVSDGESTPLIATNTGAALVVSTIPVPPVILANTTLTPSSIYLGGSSTMSATIGGTAPVSYQWQYTNNNGGTLVNIPGATNTTFTLTNAQYANAGSYRLFATNSAGSTNSSFATLAVLNTMIISDFGVAAPTPNADGNDIAQLSNAGTTVNPAGLYSYDDNNSAPGQTFTTGSNAGGYSLASVYMKFGVSGNSGNAAGLRYTLRIYSLTNAYAGTNAIIATYTNQNVAPAFAAAGGHWSQWYGPFTNVLAPNQVYAYSIQQSSGYMMQDDSSANPYLGGQQVRIGPGNGTPNYGTAGTASNYDMTFMVSLAPAGGYPKAQNVSMSVTNGSTVFAGQPVTLSVTAIGNGIGYIWQTDNQSGGASFTALPNSNTTQYSLDTSALTPGTYQFNVLVTNSIGTNTSSVLTLNVVPANILSVSIAPANVATNPVYAGTPVTLSSTVQGNNLTYYWQTDGGLGGGFANIPNSNTNVFVFSTSAMSAGTYLYQLMVSNASGTVTSSQLTLNLAAASGPLVLTGTTLTPPVVIVGNSAQMNAIFTGSQPITYQWQHAGTNIPGATATSYTLTAAQLTDAGNWSLQASNNPPGIGPITANSLAAFLYVVAAPQTNTANAVIADGGISPYVGSYDVSQLLSEDTAVNPPHLNYYVDQNVAPGQIFTTGSTPPTNFPGYYPLNYVYLKHDPAGNGNGYSTAQSYTLRVYQMLDGTNAALLTSYVTTNVLAFPAGDWVRVGGLTNLLKTNATYAVALKETTPSSYWKLDAHVSVNPIPGGLAVNLPALGGAATLSYPDINFGLYYNAAFVAGLTPPTIPVVLVDTTITPSACLVGQPVTMQATFIGLQPIAYKWQHAGTNIPSATNTTYTIAAAQFGDAGSYVLTATNSLGGAVSSPVSLTVNPYPQSFVINYAFTYGSVPATLYSGSGVIGAGSYWNQINANGSNVNSYADDGATTLNITFNSTVPNQYNNTTAGDIGLLEYYMYGGNGVATPYTFSLTNLVSGVYNLVLFSCNGGAFHDSGTGFSVNGQTNVATCSTSSSFVNNNNYVVFYNIAVTNGTINASWWKTGGREAAFNGAQLQMAFSYANPQLVIAQQPASRTNLTGTVAGFSVLAEAPGSLFYQWRSNSVPISGATNSSYSAYTGTPGVWSYDVIVSTNLSLGSPLTSDTATLTVFAPNYLVWRGYTADWDLVTGNWSNVVTLADNVIFGATDSVLFDDTATSFSPVLTGALAPSSVTVNNTANNYVLSGTGTMIGSMGLTKTGNGTLLLTNGNNTYTGGTTVNGGSLILVKGGGTSTIVGTLNINPGGTVNLNAGDALGYNAGVCLTPVNIVGGTLTNSGGNQGFISTFNLTGGKMAGVGAYNFNGASSAINTLATNVVSTISANVAMRANGLTITTAQGTVPGGIDLSITGAITDNGGNTLDKEGNGTLSLSGVNTFNGDITIGGGSLRIDGAGRLNSGNYTAQIHNNGTLFSYNSSAAQSLGVVSGTGPLTQNGPGTLTLNSVNTYTGQTTVNGGALAGNGTITSAVTVNSGGTLAPGSAGVGTLTISSNLTLHAGSTSSFTVNGTTPANTAVAVSGTVTYSGVLNVLPAGAFSNGQKFTLFSGAGTTNGSNFSSILGAPNGFAFTFTNGVLSVLSTGPSGSNHLTNSVTGSSLSLSWGPGWKLQMQTNNLSTGLRANWVYVTDGTATSTNITINPNQPTAFYRLVYP